MTTKKGFDPKGRIQLNPEQSVTPASALFRRHKGKGLLKALAVEKRRERAL